MTILIRRALERGRKTIKRTMRLLVGLVVIGAACGLAPGNVTDDAAVSERWWGGDDATDDVVDDASNIKYRSPRDLLEPYYIYNACIH